MIIMLTSTISTAEAQDTNKPLKSSYSPEELVTISQENYELLSARKAEIEQYRLEKEQASRMNNPTVEASAGIKSVPSSNGYLYGASITLPLMYPGKRMLLKELAAHDEELARLYHRDMMLFVRYEVIRLSYRYRAQLEKSKHTRERLQRFRLIQSYLDSRPLVSPEKIVERNIVREKIKMLEKNVTETLLATRKAFQQLNMFTCFCVDENEFPEISINWFSKPPVVDGETMRGKSLEQNVQLAIQQEIVQRAMTKTEYQRKKASPDVGISFFYNEENAIDTERSFGAGISIPIPILDRNASGIKASEKETEVRKLEMQYARRNLNREMSTLFSEYSTATGLVNSFSIDRIQGLLKAMRYANSEFKRGRVSLQTFLEMDNQYNDVIESTYDTQVRLVVTYTGILYNAAITQPVEGQNND